MMVNVSTILIVVGLAILFFGLALAGLWVGLVMKKGGRRACVCGRSDLEKSGRCDGHHEQPLVQINVHADSSSEPE